MSLQSFETAFSDGIGSARIQCECGITYYNSTGGWSWEAGELEALEADPNAVDLDYTPTHITFEGKGYCDACDCWHLRAQMIVGFLNGHSHKIANYFREERTRRQKEVAAIPVISED